MGGFWRWWGLCSDLMVREGWRKGGSVREGRRVDVSGMV